MTTTAIDTHADGLAANLDDLCLQSVFLKLLLNLLQATECVAVSSRASIDQQHLWATRGSMSLIGIVVIR